MSITLHQCPRCARWNQTFACPHCNPPEPRYDIRLVAAAAHECIYVAGGQPPPCREEWPGEPWKWCGACLAKAVTGAVVPPDDDPQEDVA